MSENFIDENVNKIMTDKNYEFPKNLSFAATWILANLKGVNLKVINVSQRSSIADYFILASATNPTQASAMSDLIVKQLQKHGYEVLSREGEKGSDWILLDFGDIIIHLFQETTREIFDLDSLWSTSPQEEIPTDFYYGAGQGPQKEEDVPDSFF